MTRPDSKQAELSALQSGCIPDRYQRHIQTLTAQGQMTLLNSRAVVAGLGGLGGLVLEQLARLGVGTITGIDPDTFDPTNLNRQILCTADTLGTAKTDQARKRVQAINPAISFAGHQTRFQAISPDLWSNTDIVFGCLDSIDQRIELEALCASAHVPLIHGAIAGWYCEVAIVWPESQLLTRHYQGQHQGLETELGTPAPTPGVAASLMTAKGVQVLLGQANPGQDQIHFFDLLNNDWQTTDL
ncbi:MAG: ThiF family adenylyltransferase [Phycisphaerae bacterium]|nr:ThiF family adenylyltransferase [Phycisphaerae bacterium]